MSGVLDTLGDQDLIDLAYQLGIVTNMTKISPNELRDLIKRQELRA